MEKWSWVKNRIFSVLESRVKPFFIVVYIYAFLSTIARVLVWSFRGSSLLFSKDYLIKSGFLWYGFSQATSSLHCMNTPAIGRSWNMLCSICLKVFIPLVVSPFSRCFPVPIALIHTVQLAFFFLITSYYLEQRWLALCNLAVTCNVHHAQIGQNVYTKCTQIPYRQFSIFTSVVFWTSLCWIVILGLCWITFFLKMTKKCLDNESKVWRGWKLWSCDQY